MLDSGFCVLRAIVAFYEKGIYAGSLIKKQQFWPSLVPGEAIDAHFNGKNAGDCDAISGTLNGSSYKIWGMKEPDYVMKIMATGGVLEEDDSCRMTWCGTGDSRRGFWFKKPFD